MIESRHPSYNISDYAKWRLTYTSGRDFIDTYLEKYTARESNEEFVTRRAMSYCPAFAKSTLNEVKNAIFSRMCDIRRIGGSSSYQRSINHNVDLNNSSMNAFIGDLILPELLALGKVGIYVDAPAIAPELLVQEARPYIYYYAAEDILNWAYTDGVLSKLLLRDHSYKYDDNGLPEEVEEAFRFLQLTPDGVSVTLINGEDTNTTMLNLTEIPFTFLALPTSLLSEVADYQIALLNMESSDLNYIIRSNFPFYTEQYNEKLEQAHHAQFSPDGEGDQEEREITVGVSQGRRYGAGLDRPEFIHPSPEPLLASMKKGEQLRQDIRKLINLAIDGLQSDDGLRNGLSFIALILERAERQISRFWAHYTNSLPAEVFYPEDFSLHTDETRIEKAKGLDTLKNNVVSSTYQREISKRIVDALLGGRLPQSKIMDIYNEIDTAPTLTSDPKVIHLDLENALVGNETASRARGYGPDEWRKAQADRAERIRLTMEAQGGQGGQARGVVDLQTEQPTSKDEKKGKRVRGENHG